MEENNEPALVIYHRPQITVTLTKYDEIVIATSRINTDFEKVDIDEVVIPLESVAEVAETMLALVKKRGG